MGRILGKSVTLSMAADEPFTKRWVSRHTTERAFTQEDVYEILALMKVAFESDHAADVAFCTNDGDIPYLEVTVR